MILVVDDDPGIRELLDVQLRLTLGADVVLAAGGEEALGLIGEVRPDVMIVDMQMPGIDGPELVRRVRADASRPRLPIVGISAARLEGLALGAGCDVFVAKPFTSVTLAAAVRSVAG